MLILNLSYLNISVDLEKKINALTTLLPMIENWRELLASSSNFREPLCDLSKSFGCLSHDLLIVKPHAYGLDMTSLKLLHS